MWCGTEKVHHRDRLEKQLTQISKLAGSAKKLRVEEAKTWLRATFEHEGNRLGSRLGKISKVRNGLAHVDDMLVEAGPR